MLFESANHQLSGAVEEVGLSLPSGWSRSFASWRAQAGRSRGVRLRGFTLIELLVATVLMTILLSALSGILRGFLLESRLPDSPLLNSVAAERIKMDLTNAVGYRFRAGQLDLLGPLALTPGLPEPTWMEAEVTYRIQSTVQGGLLIREQTLRRGRVRRVISDLVWLGIAAIDFDVNSGLDKTLAAFFMEEENSSLPPLPPGWQPIPSAFRMQLRDTSNRICFADSMVGGAR